MACKREKPLQTRSWCFERCKGFSECHFVASLKLERCVKSLNLGPTPEASATYGSCLDVDSFNDPGPRTTLTSECQRTDEAIQYKAQIRANQTSFEAAGKHYNT